MADKSRARLFLEATLLILCIYGNVGDHQKPLGGAEFNPRISVPLKRGTEGRNSPAMPTLFTSGLQAMQNKTPPVGVRRFRITRRESAGFRESWGIRADLVLLGISIPKKREKAGGISYVFQIHGAHVGSSRRANYQVRFSLLPDFAGVYIGGSKSLEHVGSPPV